MAEKKGLFKHFASISCSEALEQNQRDALEATELVRLSQEEKKKRKELTYVGPGRPKKELKLVEQLKDTDTDTHCSVSLSTSSSVLSGDNKRGSYHNWFGSDLIHDILQAVSMFKSSRQALSYLQRKFPRLPTEEKGRFDGLSECTIRKWYDDDWKLKAQYANLLQHNIEKTGGRYRVFDRYIEIEKEIITTLESMRDPRAGLPVGTSMIRWVMKAIIEEKQPEIFEELTLSTSFISKWARDVMSWRWREKTTAASKLPLDWQSQGITMSKRIAVHMELGHVHLSLIINFDQTGVNLVPSSKRTYEKKGTSTVAIVGVDDKRQITAVLASSLNGDMLPLQLIFGGKTPRCLPEATAESLSTSIHLTFSPNHWSSQITMQEYVQHVILPYSKLKIQQHRLQEDAKIVLVLDVWSVHKSEEFRFHMRTKYPNIHLVFVPANCTSKLQVADVMLQRPFKHGIKIRFNAWAASIIKEQITAKNITGLNESLKLATLKPNLLDWTIQSWKRLASDESRELILKGWNKCVVSLFDVHKEQERKKAVEEAAQGNFLAYGYIPGEDEEDEEEEYSDSDRDDEDERDELDVMREIAVGERRDTRSRIQVRPFGYQIDTSAIQLTETEEED